MKPKLLFIVLLFSINSFSQSQALKKDSAIYSFKVRLVKALPHPPYCGVITFALLQKFEVVETNFLNYSKKYVLIVQPCPDFLDSTFFKTGKLYQFKVIINKPTSFDCYYTNKYIKENLPVYYSQNVIRLD